MAMFLKKDLKKNKDDRLVPLEGAPRRKKTQFFKFPPWKEVMSLAGDTPVDRASIIKSILSEDEVFYPDGFTGPDAIITGDSVKQLRAVANRGVAVAQRGDDSTSDSEDDSEASTNEDDGEYLVYDDEEDEEEALQEDSLHSSSSECSDDEEEEIGAESDLTRPPIAYRGRFLSSAGKPSQSGLTSGRASYKKARKLSTSDEEGSEDEFMFLRPPIKDAKKLCTSSEEDDPEAEHGNRGGSAEEKMGAYRARAMTYTPPIKSNDESYPWPWL